MNKKDTITESRSYFYPQEFMKSENELWVHFESNHLMHETKTPKTKP